MHKLSSHGCGAKYTNLLKYQALWNGNIFGLFYLKTEVVRSFESSVFIYRPKHSAKSGKRDFYLNLSTVILTSHLQYMKNAKQCLGE
jgi:hypothetical protein